MKKPSDKDTKELTKWLRKMLNEEDLIASSKVLPIDHPIRPALKAAINIKKGGSYENPRK